MGPLGRRGREPVAALLVASALVVGGLGSCANIWGFDDLRGTRDGGPTDLSVTSVGVGADAGSGGNGGGPGSDAQAGVGGAAGLADDAGLTDVGTSIDTGSQDSGPPDVPGSTSQDA